MASTALTERQTTELNQAVLEYFLANSSKFPKTIEALREEANLGAVTASSGKNLLEKKWTSVVRLQKRVMELESKIANIRDIDSSGGGSSSSGSGGEKKNFPRAPPKATLSGHREPITCVTMHPTYSICASGSEDTTIRIWDFESEQYERTLKGHTGPVTGLAFDPVGGKLLASCSSDMTAKLWDVGGGTYACVKTLRGHDHSISGVAFVIPSADFLLTCSRDQTIKYWDVSTGYCNKTFTGGHNDWVKCISVSLDGEWVASGSSDHTIVVWKLSTGQVVQTLRGHEHVVESVAFGKKPIMAMVNESLQQPGQGQGQNSDESGAAAPAESQSVPQAHQYSYLVSGSRDKSVRLWDVVKGEALGVFHVHDNWVRGVLFHPSGKHIISCSDDRSIKVIDIKESRSVRNISDAHSHFVTCIAAPPMAIAAGSSSKPSRSAHCVYVTGSVDKNLSIWGSD